MQYLYLCRRESHENLQVLIEDLVLDGTVIVLHLLSI